MAGEDYVVVSASAHSQWETLAQQAKTYGLRRVVLTDTTHLEDLRRRWRIRRRRCWAGLSILVDLAADPGVDTIIVAVVGAAGLPAVLAATKAGKTLAIANKESLVVAGCLLMPLAKEYGATLLRWIVSIRRFLQAMHSGRVKRWRIC